MSSELLIISDLLKVSYHASEDIWLGKRVGSESFFSKREGGGGGVWSEEDHNSI